MTRHNIYAETIFLHVLHNCQGGSELQPGLQRFGGEDPAAAAVTAGASRGRDEWHLRGVLGEDQHALPGH